MGISTWQASMARFPLAQLLLCWKHVSAIAAACRICPDGCSTAASLLHKKTRQYSRLSVLLLVLSSSFLANALDEPVGAPHLL
jgi:hypothetical protein